HPTSCVPDRADEKGYIDYVMLAFSIFGLKVQSLYSFYFLVLGVSLSAFVVQFFRRIEFLALAPIILAAHHATVLVLPDGYVTSVLHDGHFIPAVACLAALHVASRFLLRDEHLLWSLPALVVQLAVILIALNCR